MSPYFPWTSVGDRELVNDRRYNGMGCRHFMPVEALMLELGAGHLATV